MSRLTALLCALSLLVVLSPVQIQAAPQSVYTGKEGQACHIVSGIHKGKSGTYDEDGDCVADGTYTGCKNSDGTSNGKCADGKAKLTDLPIFDLLFWPFKLVQQQAD